ncbi:hypothetical protein [Aestuariivivens sediminis]|nr:hypothetical protein [Aestuariivivens sediminis]
MTPTGNPTGGVGGGGGGTSFCAIHSTPINKNKVKVNILLFCRLMGMLI